MWYEAVVFIQKIKVCIFPTPLPQLGCDTRSIFLVEYNWFGCHTKDPSMFCYLLIAGGEKMDSCLSPGY